MQCGPHPQLSLLLAPLRPQQQLQQQCQRRRQQQRQLGRQVAMVVVVLAAAAVASVVALVLALAAVMQHQQAIRPVLGPQKRQRCSSSRQQARSVSAQSYTAVGICSMCIWAAGEEGLCLPSLHSMRAAALQASAV